MTEWLINRARSFIFSTAPPPALAAAARTAVDFLSSKEGEKRRQRLRRNIDILAEELSIQPASAIVPWIIGDEKATLAAAQNLQDNGFLVPAIRYPTVAKGAARLRITDHAFSGARSNPAAVAGWRDKTPPEKRLNETDSPITECARTPSSGATDSALTPGFDRPSREHRPEHLLDLRPEAPVLRLACRARSHCSRTWSSGVARAFGWPSSSEKWSNKLGGARG